MRMKLIVDIPGFYLMGRKASDWTYLYVATVIHLTYSPYVVRTTERIGKVGSCRQVEAIPPQYIVLGPHQRT